MRGAISLKLFLTLAALILLPALSYGQAGTLDLTFGTNGVLLTRPPLLNTNSAGPVANLVELNTGDLVGLASAGDSDPNTFRNVLVRTTADGQLVDSFGYAGYVYITWTAPNPGLALNMAIQTMLDGSERIVIAGSEQCSGKSCTRVERYSAEGEPDTSFGSNGKTHLQVDSGVTGDIVILPDGKILLGGGLNPLARLTADGIPDGSFGPGGVSRTKPVVGIQALKLHEGKIIAAGTISAGSTNNFGIARFDLSGKLDTSFGSSGKVSLDFAKMNDIAADITVDAYGRILVCGEATYTKTSPTPRGYDAVIVRLTPTGQLDTTFGNGGKTRLDISGGQDFFKSIMVQPDGGIVVAGEGRATSQSRADILTARYTENGVLDETYYLNGWNLIEFSDYYDYAQSALLQYDADCDCVKLVAGGGVDGGSGRPEYQVLLRYLL